MNFRLHVLLPAAGALLLAACSAPQATLVNPREVDKKAPEYVNPFPASSHAHFVAGKDYPQTYATYSNPELVNLAGSKKQKVVICLQEQRGRYYVNDQVAMDFPVSTGVRSYPTPAGNYKIIGKKPDHVSNMYGKMYDAEGKMINGDAKSSDPVPEGGKFVGSPMPNWMRLTGDGVGMHIGKVGRSPRSHGCIRLQKATAQSLYAKLPVGTPVTIRQAPEELESVLVMPAAKKS